MNTNNCVIAHVQRPERLCKKFSRVLGNNILTSQHTGLPPAADTLARARQVLPNIRAPSPISHLQSIAINKVTACGNRGERHVTCVHGQGLRVE
jgi:hypothetical protein